MEQSYWLSRKSASAANARKSRCAEARLVHLDLAGRYSVKAAVAAAQASGAPAAALPAMIDVALPDLADAAYYERLETGARWLASKAADEVGRDEHLGMANKYARLRLEFRDRR